MGKQYDLEERQTGDAGLQEWGKLVDAPMTHRGATGMESRHRIAVRDPCTTKKQQLACVYVNMSPNCPAGSLC